MSVTLAVDSAHGARLTSLRDASGFEWMWSRPDPARFGVSLGDAFVDVGGGEECYPTISGVPDHGEVWSQPWHQADGGLQVDAPSGRLHRRNTISDRTVRLDYRLEARPGFAFIWALHAMLTPDVGTTLAVPGEPEVSCWTHGDDAPAVRTRWPLPDTGGDLHSLAPGDGTARFVAVHTDEITVTNPRGNCLRVHLECDQQPHAIGVWRNLGGYPGGGVTYRSFGIEPMLGTHHHLGYAKTHELAKVPADGTLTWTVTLETGHGNTS